MVIWSKAHIHLMFKTSQFPKGVYMVSMISPAVLRDGIENQKLIVE